MHIQFFIFYFIFPLVNLGLFKLFITVTILKIFNFWIVGLILMLEWTCKYSNMASTGWHIYPQFIVIEHEKCRKNIRPVVLRSHHLT
jgi:hypothetical protein